MSETTSHIEELVRFIVTSLVDTPDAVQISTVAEDNHITVTIEADGADVGKIIGRGGRTIKSIRTLARASVGTPAVLVDIDVEG
jgi:predicted RNA-binding protein YlqC (UPF0109 family)